MKKYNDEYRTRAHNYPRASKDGSTSKREFKHLSMNRLKIVAQQLFTTVRK
jgi:hypothetical protein